MGTIDTSDFCFKSARNYDFLKDLPVQNPQNFSKCSRDRIFTKVRPMCVHHVPLDPNEKRIYNDRVPLILNYLKNHWTVFPKVEANNDVLSRGQKRDYSQCNSDLGNANEKKDKSTMTTCQSNNDDNIATKTSRLF